jgi:hypothetical protein
MRSKWLNERRECSALIEIPSDGTSRAPVGGWTQREATAYRGFMYQKIASATKATVTIQRTISLLRFLSSAMRKVHHS